MNRENAIGVKREFDFTDEHFQRIQSFVTANTGIVLSPIKKSMVYGRLTKRIRKYHSGSFDAFCKAIEEHNPDETEFLINAITTNLTSFFREPHHFDDLREHVIPQLLEENKLDRKIRIWSAGCSTGEEPYSIAMTLYECIPDIEQWDIKILATDLDANVLQQAKKGIYDIDRVTDLPESLVKPWFRKGKGQFSGLVKVHADLQKMVYFRRLNLLHPWPMQNKFDVIFCRNVVIYFDKVTQSTLFERFADKLIDQGHLFIGHSETLYNITDKFEHLGSTIYRRIK